MSPLLLETATNPAPAGIRSGLLSLGSGKTLRYALVQSEQRPLNGTVVLLQGRNEFIEKYYETMQDLTARGFHVASFDWRGQGGSYRLLRDPMRGFVRRFSDYSDDLDQFLTQIVLPDCPPPYYILAHSMGALVAIRSVPRLASRISRMVLCAPLLGLRHPKFSDDTLRRLSRLMRLLGLGKRYASEGPHLNARRAFAGNPLTHDRARFERNQEMVHLSSDIAIGGPTIAWLQNVLHALRDMQKGDYFGHSAMPSLILAAGGDPLISLPAIERFAGNHRNFSLITIDGARHELLQEEDFYRAQVLAAFDAFIPGSNLPEMPSAALENAMD